MPGGKRSFGIKGPLIVTMGMGYTHHSNDKRIFVIGNIVCGVKIVDQYKKCYANRYILVDKMA